MSLVLLLAARSAFPDLVGAYEQAVERAEWRTVRGVAAEIAALEDERAIPFLERELSLAGQGAHLRAVFAALAGAPLPDKALFLRGHLGSPEPFVRATALEALAGLEPEAARERAADLVRIDEDIRVRRVAAALLVADGTPTALRAVLRGIAVLPPGEQAPMLALVHGVDAGRLAGVADLAASVDAELRLVVMLAIAARPDASLRPVLESGSRDRDPRVAVAASVGLARLSGDGRDTALRTILQRPKGFDERWELYDLIARAGLRDPVVTEVLKRAARSGTTSLRPKAAEALGHAAGADAVPVLAPLLRDTKRWQLPVGAARGLAATRAPEAVPPLVAALEGAEGRLRWELGNALEALTGQPFGRNAALWARWWREQGAGFLVPAASTALWEEEAASDGRYAFYGIEIHSDSAMFACDISGSMRGEKIETLKRELEGVIRRFPAGGRLGMVFFRDEVVAWSERLRPASPATKEKALAFVETLEANGSTNLWGALEAGLEDPRVDTLVLLTDGVPSAGEVRRPDEIAARFLATNRERMVLLHVVSIGQPAPWLGTMARLTGGRCVGR